MPASKKPKETPIISPRTKKRVLHLPHYKSFKLQKPIKATQPSIVGGWALMRQSFGVLFRHYKLFLGIMVVYAILNVVFIQGFKATADIGSLKESIEQGASGQDSSKILSGVGLFTYLLGSSGGGNANSSAYQMLLIIITSLAVIWALREVTGGNKVRVRDGFYKGMYPFIPFVLILLVLTIQAIPLAAGVTVYNLVSNNEIMVGFERVLWMFMVFMTAVWTLYMMASSVVALYISTLPDMAPLQALRIARNIVMHRRWMVIRKLAFLILFALILSMLVTLPFILWLTPIAPWVFTALSLFGLAVINSYLYNLYLELLK